MTKGRITKGRITKGRITGVIVGVVLSMGLILLRPGTAQASSLSGITSSTIQTMQNQISKAQKEREQLKNSLSSVQKLVKQLEKEKSNLNNYVAKLDANLVEIEERIRQLTGQIAETEDRLAQTQLQLEAAMATEASQHDSMGAHIQLIYEKGTSHYIRLLFSAESFGDFLNKLTYVNAMAQYDREMLDAFVANREYIELCKEQLDVEKALLDETKAGVEAEQQALEALISEKAAEIRRYENNINTQEKAIKEFEAELAEQTEIISQLEAAVIAEQKKILEESGVVLEYDGGAFVFPLASYTRVSSEFGWRVHPILNVNQYHNGVDFAAPKGTNIYAAYDGVVVAATYSSTMGNYVMINHGGGLYTIYMHASKLMTKKDEIVVRGEKIAEVGSTGRSTGNHLHFTVRKDGDYVSPWNYISK